MEYRFYGWQGADVPAVNKEYSQIRNPKHLYELLSEIWCPYTCAPRMRDRWTKENMTLGQCSITAFLAQDIFGGQVYGVLRPGGNYHCYNVIGDCVFDLTSEQFTNDGIDLSYEGNPEQLREVHFAKEEKRLRYEYLKRELKYALKSEERFKVGDTVQHFKREYVNPESAEYLYRILAFASHTENGEKLVVYQALYPPYKTCARPYDMFISEVDREKYPDAKQKYRFEVVETEMFPKA